MAGKNRQDLVTATFTSPLAPAARQPLSPPMMPKVADPHTITKRTVIATRSDMDLAISMRYSGGVAIRMRPVASRWQ